MKALNVDVAVIGSGTAGLAAYRAAKTAGATVALIEGGEYGTTCARVGCMPSKLLIAAAEAVHAAQLAPAFGVHIDGKIRIDGRDVMARLRSERDRFVDFVTRDVERIPEADRIRGHARFENDHTLLVDGTLRITAKSIVIATGSRVTYPDAFRKLGERLIINDDVFAWTDLPEAVAVIGPGVIGLELGQALHRLGVRVAVLGRGGRVGPIADPEIRAYAIQTFSRELVLEPDAHFVGMEREGDRVAIRRGNAEGVEFTEHFDYLLAATGRSPNVDRIGLENTTIDRDAAGVPVFDSTTAQTVNAAGPAPIFVAGDASNFIPLLHEAADEGRIAGENAARVAAGKPVGRGIRRAPLGVVFTDPQIAIVGGGWQALEQGRFVVGQVSFEDQGRSRVLLKNQGLLNVYGDVATGRLLGAEMIGPAAEHLGHLLAWALQNQMTIPEMLEMPFYHPVIEEGLRTALRDLDGKLRSAHARAVRAA
ncbi:MAG: dihydrolipoamide dehydrogenase [Betaproteobacteria bacterium]|nr:dihydrolipoamide dehydrogenase [Betaproteobacteria bacterium]